MTYQHPYLGQPWELPDPVPEDLLLPFGEFVEKYNLQNVAYTIAQLAIRNGNVFEQPTIYVLKAVDTDYIRGIVFGEAVAPVTYDSQSLFNKALVGLGSNVLLSSTVSNALAARGGRSTDYGRAFTVVHELYKCCSSCIRRLA